MTVLYDDVLPQFVIFLYTTFNNLHYDVIPDEEYKCIDPFTITAILHSSGTFVSGNNTLFP